MSLVMDSFDYNNHDHLYPFYVKLEINKLFITLIVFFGRYWRKIRNFFIYVKIAVLILFISILMVWMKNAFPIILILISSYIFFYKKSNNDFRFWMNRYTLLFFIIIVCYNFSKNNITLNSEFYFFFIIITFMYIFLLIITTLIMKTTTLITKSIKQTLVFLIPFPYYVSYPSKYNWFKDLFNPQPSPFIETDNIEFYKTWNGEALINFKWRVYGVYYYLGIWLLHIIFLTIFIIASRIPDVRNYFLAAFIVFGCFNLLIEIRQFFWNPLKWLLDFWNFFGM